ncbi:MAG: transposase [Candidatus Latescibacteria bacterium]|nr:transposase [Candidatus Latescibacterota bacterium]
MIRLTDIIILNWPRRRTPFYAPSKVGRASDGADSVERLHGPSKALECELLDRRSFPNHKTAKLAIFEYIEGWYNPRRRHSALGYKPPINYEKLMAQTAFLESSILSTKAG